MEIRLLGPIEAIGGSDQPVLLAGKKERIVLAALALRANQVVSVDRLTDALWAENPPANAANSLQAHISRLRKRLAAAGEAEALVSAPGGYALRVRPSDVDAVRFEDLVRTTTGEPADVAARLSEALALWRGPALSDIPSDEVRSDRVRLQELRLLAQERLVDVELALGHHDQVISELQALLEVDPLREGPRRQLMVALYRVGRQADALAVYREGEKILMEEMGVDPGPELQALELAILRHDPAIAAPADRADLRPTAPPSGTLTLLVTDIEGSTRLWEENPESMLVALRRHDDLMRGAIEASSGYVFKTVGDSFCCAFLRAREAIQAAETAQRVLRAEPWPDGAIVRVRMALHTGECEERDGDYFGAAVNRVARLTSAAHGGQVLVSRSTAEIAEDHLPAGVGLRDMGTHHLKDLSRPEAIFQLEVDGLPSEFPPLRSLDNPALLNNLPEFVSSFVGRNTEMREVRKLVSDNRLVTLTGAGGAGKSRLAVQAAAELLDETRDGVWLVELANVSDPAAVPVTVANALGVSGRPNQDTTDTLVEVLSGQQRLVVLDNCEHLLDGCAHLVDSIVRHCPGMHVLGTSREPLRIDGEVVYRVPPLSLPPEDTADNADVITSGAVMLFVDRARSQRPDFALRDDDVLQIASICRRLDGMPLAIELATARLRSMSLAELNDRLEHRFGLLTSGSRAALPRQQTLRSLVDWSFDLLTDPEQVLFRRLSVFLGGFDLDAAESVCTLDDLRTEDVVDVIASLVDKSMVVADGSGDIARYELLETLRQYAVEKLDGVLLSETERLRSAHSAHYISWAHEAVPNLLGPSQNAWFARFDRDYPNLRMAVEHLLDARELVKLLQFFRATRVYWSSTEHHAWVADVMDKTIERGGGELSSWAQAASLICKASALTMDNFDDAARCAREATDAARAARDRALESEALGLVCACAAFCGNPADGIAPGSDAVALARQLDDPRLLAVTLMHLGIALGEAGDLSRAEAIYREGLHVVGRGGDATLAQLMRVNFGMVLLAQGRFAEAGQQWEAALELGPSPSLLATLLSNLGSISLEESDLMDAEMKFARALSAHRLRGPAFSTAYDVLGLAICASRSGDAVHAATLHGGASAIIHSCGAVWESAIEKRYRDSDIAVLKASLGDEFQTLYDVGGSMRSDAVVELALGRITSSSE